MGEQSRIRLVRRLELQRDPLRITEVEVRAALGRVDGWLAVFWIVMIPTSMWAGWLNSVVYVSALSLWALLSGHRSAWQAARGGASLPTVAAHRETPAGAAVRPRPHDVGVTIPAPVLELLRAPSPCFVTTLMEDGSPQTTQTWVDTDGEHVVINTVEGYQKVHNVSRDPRVTVVVSDPEESFRYAEIRGQVVGMTTEGGAEHIEELSQKYTGGPYQNYSGRPQTRVILTIRADKVHTVG